MRMSAHLVYWNQHIWDIHRLPETRNQDRVGPPCSVWLHSALYCVVCKVSHSPMVTPPVAWGHSFSHDAINRFTVSNDTARRPGSPTCSVPKLTGHRFPSVKVGNPYQLGNVRIIGDEPSQIWSFCNVLCQNISFLPFSGQAGMVKPPRPPKIFACPILVTARWLVVPFPLAFMPWSAV